MTVTVVKSETAAVVNLLRLARSECGATLAFATLRTSSGDWRTQCVPPAGTMGPLSRDALDELVRQASTDPELPHARALVRTVRAGTPLTLAVAPVLEPGNCQQLSDVDHPVTAARNGDAPGAAGGAWRDRGDHVDIERTGSARTAGTERAGRVQAMIGLLFDAGIAVDEPQLDLLSQLAERLGRHARALERIELMRGRRGTAVGDARDPDAAADEAPRRPITGAGASAVSGTSASQVAGAGPSAEPGARGGAMPHAGAPGAASREAPTVPFADEGIGADPGPGWQAPIAGAPATVPSMGRDVPWAPSAFSFPGRGPLDEGIVAALSPPTSTDVTGGRSVPDRAFGAVVGRLSVQYAEISRPQGRDDGDPDGWWLAQDSRTGLPSVAQFFSRAGRLLTAELRTTSTLAVVLVEVPDPQTAPAAARALSAQLRYSDPLARIERDLFAVAVLLVPGIASGDAVEQRLGSAVRAALDWLSPVRTTHVLAAPGDRRDIDALVRQAIAQLPGRTGAAEPPGGGRGAPPLGSPSPMVTS